MNDSAMGPERAAEAEARTRKPWGAPRVIVSSVKNTESGVLVPTTDGGFGTPGPNS